MKADYQYGWMGVKLKEKTHIKLLNFTKQKLHGVVDINISYMKFIVSFELVIFQ
jgi:hypothetical protein